MVSSLWKDIKKSFKEGVSVAAEKTEEYTRIGKVKVEMVNVRKNMDKVFKALGEEVYASVKKGTKASLGQNRKVKDLIAKIDGLKKSLKAKEAEVEAIKKEAAARHEKEPESSPAPKAKTTGTKKTTTKRTTK